MKLDDDRRKLLTKYLGECWHEPSDDDYMLCRHCGITFQGSWRDDGGFRHMEAIVEQRTFKTDTDMMTLFRAIFSINEWDASFVPWLRYHPDYDTTIPEIFREPEKFCFLVSEWLKERGK